MAKKSKKVDLKPIILATVIALGGGFIVGYASAPKGVNPQKCAASLKEIGGNDLAVKYVCEGKSLKEILPFPQGN